ncbi:MAG: family 20 glycosylhydrolase, partial [Opitutaceae bacterium]
MRDSSLIPLPQHAKRLAGTTTLSAGTTIVYPPGARELEPAARHLQLWLGDRTTGLPQPPTCREIHLTTEPALAAEAYDLFATPERIAIRGGDAAGVFYGLQTLKQMTRPWTGGQAGLTLPCVEINDAPAFSYRGMHLDVVRHFFPVTFIKKYIDLLAGYKMNRFHWHLTDDQGWRIEIKQYPRLQEVAAFRRETMIGHLDDQ